ncbi:MAG: UPF0147 family protein [Nanoarchaeota archaeon]
MIQNFDDIVTALQDLQADSGVPKNVRAKVQGMIEDLRSVDDSSVIVNRLLSELEDIGNDINLQSFIRTQIYNISSMLEVI